MFAKRTNWRIRSGALACSLAATRASGQPLVDLSESNPTACSFAYLQPSVLAPLTNPAALRYNPDPRGMIEARQSIAAYYSARGVQADPDHIFITSGTSEAYGFLFRLLLDPGERILVPRPSYPLLDVLADLHDVQLIPYLMHYDGLWWTDLDTVEAALDPSVRALFTVSPNNPTGSCLRKQEQDRLVCVAHAHGAAIIADEVFGDYVYTDDSSHAATMASSSKALTFTCSGISKILGLPQMKIGWILVGGPDDLASEACRRLEVIADTYLSANTPVQCALAAWFARRASIQAEIMERTRGNLASLRSLLAGSRTEPLHVDGGWTAVIRLPRTRTEEEWLIALLDKDRVLLDPGQFYGFDQDGYAVLSLLPPPDVFREGIGRLAERLER